MSLHCGVFLLFFFSLWRLSWLLIYVILGSVPELSGFILCSLLYPAEQAVYNRPQLADKTRSKEGKDTVEAYQLAQRLQSMVRFGGGSKEQSAWRRSFQSSFSAVASQEKSPLIQFAVSLERPVLSVSVWVQVLLSDRCLPQFLLSYAFDFCTGT